MLQAKQKFLRDETGGHHSLQERFQKPISSRVFAPAAGRTPFAKPDYLRKVTGVGRAEVCLLGGRKGLRKAS
jgi:hypothetical protein